MNDFFEQQDIARRRTWLLLLYFCLAVSALVMILTLALHILLSFNPARLYQSTTPFALSPREWEISGMLPTATLILSFILGVSLYKYRQLCSGGGGMIAEMLGGRIIFPDTTDQRERRLLNVVEEMALASGVTVPSVYLLPSESGINAFAAGYRQEDAVLGLTRGCLDHLRRDELQGVIAHEMSHILNGDMLLNIRLQGLLHGILIIGMLGKAMIRTPDARKHHLPGSKGRGGPLQIVLGLMMVIIGHLGLLTGRLIKAAISRQREYLADAAAVQFTRNPLGLAGALKKIGGQTSGSRLRHSQAPILSHMYFADGLAAKLAALSTHPPLDRRIRRLDPEFDGRFPALRGIEPGEAFHEIFPLEEGVAAASGNFPDPLSSPDLFHDPTIVATTPEKVLRTMGNPTMEHMRHARQLIDSLPPQVLKAARNPFEARAVIYCLLLDSHEELRGNQLILLENHTDPRTWQACRKLMPDLLKMPREGRLPLVDLCLPALTLLSSVQYRDFGKNIELLVKADQKINLFEFALHHLLKRHLGSRFGKAEQNYFRQGSIPAVKEEISCILSLLARAGQSGSAAETTFRQAAAVFKKDAALFSFQSPERCSLKHLDLALTLLGRVSFAIRAKVINACLECIIHDEKITIEEAEILRAIADALGCPVPPWLRGPAAKTDERDVNSAR